MRNIKEKMLKIIFFTAIAFTVKKIWNQQEENNFNSLELNQHVLKHISNSHVNRRFSFQNETSNQLNDQDRKIPKNSFIGNNAKLIFNIKNNQNRIISKTAINESVFLQMINDQKQGITKDPIDLNKTQICDENNICRPIKQYMILKVRKFSLDVNDHLDKNRVPPTLVTYPVS